MRPSILLAALALLVAFPASAADVALPLPDAPVRVLIPDAPAFDRALGGAWRRALTGEIDESDPVVAGWRRTQVGAKLEDQWRQLSPDLPWTWDEIRKLQPRSVGLSLLNVGHLEAVLVIDTPLAALPLAPPEGQARTHAGAAYQLVAAGAGDDQASERRMGLAWARIGERLILATSERALRLAIDQAISGTGFAPPLPGLLSLELDLDALRRDLYFRREFRFGDGPETGRIRAALRQEGDALVEVREGTSDTRPDGFSFDAPGASALAWEPDGEGLFPALRAALLEPYPTLSDRPLPPLTPLPAPGREPSDRYLVDLRRPLPAAGGAAGEPGELSRWHDLFAAHPVAGWGYWLTADGGRRLLFPWPQEKDAELIELCRSTLARRAGRVALASEGAVQVLRGGPDLELLALRRTSGFLWIAGSAADLATVVAPRPAEGVIRWAHLDLEAVRAQAGRFERAEGPPSPERVRPFSDRILGLLGWMPDTRRISVERRRTAQGWSERLVLGP